MQSHSREATGTVTPFDKYAESQSRSDCYPILLNMQRHSREAIAMPRRRGVAASMIYITGGQAYIHVTLIVQYSAYGMVG